MTDNTKGLATDLPEGLVTEPEFHLGETVEKIKGYKLPGVVVAKFYNLKGQLRYVVECTVPEVAGLLHIYSGKDLQRRYNPALCLPDGDTDVQDAVRVLVESLGPVKGITLGEKYEGKITEREAIELINAVLKAQREIALQHPAVIAAQKGDDRE